MKKWNSKLEKGKHKTKLYTINLSITIISVHNPMTQDSTYLYTSGKDSLFRKVRSWLWDSIHKWAINYLFVDNDQLQPWLVIGGPQLFILSQLFVP
jgi:hypothetical protein